MSWFQYRNMSLADIKEDVSLSKLMCGYIAGKLFFMIVNIIDLVFLLPLIGSTVFRTDILIPLKNYQTWSGL